MKPHLWILTTCLLVSGMGCATTHNLERLSLNMTKDDVRRVIGSPTDVRGALKNKYGETIEVWEYVLSSVNLLQAVLAGMAAAPSRTGLPLGYGPLHTGCTSSTIDLCSGAEQGIGRKRRIASTRCGSDRTQQWLRPNDERKKGIEQKAAMGSGYCGYHFGVPDLGRNIWWSRSWPSELPHRSPMVCGVDPLLASEGLDILCS